LEKQVPSAAHVKKGEFFSDPFCFVSTGNGGTELQLPWCEVNARNF